MNIRDAYPELILAAVMKQIAERQLAEDRRARRRARFRQTWRRISRSRQN